MHKTIAIMQPYFLPYMGYWQLINAVDEFVVYDNIKYTKKGWINRNRFLQNGKDNLFSLPLQADSNDLYVSDRYLSDSFDRGKLIRQLKETYKKAPHYEENFPLIDKVINFEENHLSKYIENSIRTVSDYLEIPTPVISSSKIEIDHASLKGKDKVIAICKSLGAESYINPIGGLDLYDKEDFKEGGIELSFLRSRILDYSQFGNSAIPHMSILDVLMFNSRDTVIGYLDQYDME